MSTDGLSLLVQLIGPLLGAGVGSYFGLKSALNGLRDSSRRIENGVGDIRDYVIRIDYSTRRP